MPDDKLNQQEPSTENGSDYQTPAIEEVVSPESLEREVAYAGEVGPTLVYN